MPPGKNQLETLKYILDNSLNPEVLDSHPWTKNLIVAEAVTENPELGGKSPGQQLVITVAKFFIQMMPSTAPRRGKRLDTNWGEFGILAAQYFVPLLFGSPNSVSLRDAWGHIDQSILLFVFGKPEDTLSDAEKETYKLVGNELEVAPISTLSGWHRKGLQRLADVILARENYLATSLSKPGLISPDTTDQNIKIQRSGRRRLIIPLLSLILLGLILIGGFKALKIYDSVALVYQDAVRIQELAAEPTPRLERVKAIGPALSTLRQDFKTLKKEAEPFFWMGPWLNWVPVYGGDLASIRDLAAVADSLLASADLSYQAVLPLVEEDGLSSFNPARLTKLLKQAQPQLMKAQQILDQALTARSRLKPDNLSPRVRDLIVNKVDRLLAFMQDGLTIAVEFPRLMGATDEGPKTYLLLVQNEDELRPTGGFITAAGTLLVRDGRISTLTFENSGNLDDWSRPYPTAPWQLIQYMNTPVLTLRDANWFTNYPTAALYAENLYSYTNSHSVDGVIAFDQQMLVEILGVTGSVEVEDAPYLIDASNVISYMRTSKIPTPEELVSYDWNKKLFINKITSALIAKIFSGDVQWEQLSMMLLRAMNEHHLLVQLDGSTMTSLLARNHWDGVVRPSDGDFLMVVDTNVGFNKTNAVVETSYSYDVDLTRPLSPIASLEVVHKNNAAKLVFCRQWDKVKAPGEELYPITDCYWDYLRVYTLLDTKLLGAAVQTVPANWMILQRRVPPQVDVLNEGVEGARAFGTLKVVPARRSLTTEFRFALPPETLEVQPNSNQMTYRLKIQKQPGTLGTPVTVRVRLPDGAVLQTIPSGATVKGQNVLVQVALTTDVEIEIIFLVP